MSFLSRLHTDLRRSRLTRRGATQNPEAVARGLHKEYPRMERVPLPESAGELAHPYETLLEKRSSAGAFCAEGLSAAGWSALLAGLRAFPEAPRRRYPSGGALFPVETYILAFAPGDIRGVFHYHPKEHVLERLWDIPQDIESADFIRAEEESNAGSVILFTCVWDRTSAKYGDFSYTLALLEAGHMSQNILLAATALDLVARPLAGFDDELAHRLLDIDEHVEQPILAIAVGKKSPDEIGGKSQYEPDTNK